MINSTLRTLITRHAQCPGVIVGAHFIDCPAHKMHASVASHDTDGPVDIRMVGVDGVDVGVTIC